MDAKDLAEGSSIASKSAMTTASPGAAKASKNKKKRAKKKARAAGGGTKPVASAAASAAARKAEADVRSLDDASARSFEDASSSPRSSLSAEDASSYRDASDREEDEEDDFSSESEEEETSSYKPGGYHPVKIGEVYNERFEVLEKLGWGHFSTVWKCLDRATGDIVAMKVQKSARHYTEAARDEIELLECAVSAAKKDEAEKKKKKGGQAGQYDDTSHVVQLVDSFEHVGPNGSHVCMVFEMLGDNLLTLIKYYNYRGVPVRLVQRLTKDILSGLAFLHTKCQIIHTDLKPENVLLSHRIPQLPKLRKSEWMEFNRKRRAAKTKEVGKSGKSKKLNQPALVSALMAEQSAPTSELSKGDKKKLKNKLKKKRQKMKKQQQQQGDVPAADDDGEVDDEEDKLVATMEKLDVSETRDAVFASNFQLNGQQNGQCKATDAACQVRDEDEKDWVHLPPEFAARVMILLPDGRVAGSKKKEIEFTLSVPSKNSGSAQVDTSCVLRYLDRIDQDFVESLERKLQSVVSEASSATAPATNQCAGKTVASLRLWRLEFDARYTLPVLDYLEKRLEGVRFLNCASGSDVAIPGFFLPTKYAKNAGAYHQNGKPTGVDRAVDNTSGSEDTAAIIQGINLQALGWRDVSGSVDVKPLQQRLARWESQLAQIAATKPFDIMELNAKVCDLGNACWTTKHFTDDIQTRQYRCPEVIVGKKYDTSADVWSMACFVFELVTGDLLFDPKSGRNFNRDDDHLAQMMELLGRMPKAFTGSQRGAKEFFTRKGDLKHIKSLKFWSLRDVLAEKYRFSPRDAELLASFLLPMLRYEPAKRATADECLAHPWVAAIGHDSDSEA